MSRLQKTFYRIGDNLIRDCKSYKKYTDLDCDPQKGIVPRGLFYEDEKYGRKGKFGCVIVGMNPGQARSSERNFFRNLYKRKQLTYKNSLEYLWQIIEDHKYYIRMRRFADDVGLKGPILWTELIKCQGKRNGLLLTETIRDDIYRYLFQELKKVPSNWPLIAVGWKTYEILAFSFPKKLVIGVPHVTGSYGHFDRMLQNNRLRPELRKELQRAIKIGKPIAVSAGFKYKRSVNNKGR